MFVQLTRGLAMHAAKQKLPSPPREGLLPIRTVSILTGVNAVTIRAWERRYGLITPQRTPKGHRLYTHQDVEHIKQIVELLKQGISVGHVKPLLDQTPGEASVQPATDSGDIWKQYLDSMLDAIERFDEPALDSSYNDALSLYPVDIVNQRLTTPLLRLLGERWNLREAGIAEEHFFTVYLRNKLGTRIHHMNQRSHAPLLLLACLPGELHEIGLLFFALSAVSNGYRVLILGANTPLQQIPAVLERKSCAGIVLSSSAKPARGVIDSGLPELASRIPVPVFVGGKAAVTYREALEDSGIICLGEDIAQGIQRVTETLKAAGSR
jgi:DNA-binding transcriptional MerR regulator